MNTVSENILDAPLWCPGNPATGPVTASRYRRNALVYGLLVTLGMLPTFLQAPAAWQAAGIGMWLPGAGFLAVGGWAMLLFPLTMGLFAASVLAWFWCGMVVAPLTIWLGSAALAGAMAGSEIWVPAVYVAPLLALSVFLYRQRRMAVRRKADMQRAQVREAYLPQSMAEVAELVKVEPVPGERELSLEDLQALRVAYDAALQPIGQYKGYEIIDQFQPAALRYAINHVGFIMALVQANYAPNFHGYLRQAQRNLIDTYRERKVWGYWVYESMWGHLNFTNFDPARKDNIMLTGWYGMQVGAYMLATGDHQYNQPGALTFKLDEGTQYTHDYHSIVKNVLDNNKTSDYCMFPCEPNWVYPICNMYGMASLVTHDALAGTSWVKEILPKWLHVLDTEFTSESGSLVGLRSYWTGIQFPFYTGEVGFAPTMNIFAPKRAQRMWAIARKEIEFCLTKDVNGEMRVTLPKLTGIDAIDPGNYRPGLVPAYATIIHCAREFGDEALADAAQRSLDQDCGLVVRDGKRYYTKGSRSANFWAIEGRLVRTGDFRRLFTQSPPESAMRGPILAEARYPMVQVAKAFSRGDDLALVLYPGDETGPQQIGIERLKPGATYRIEGDRPGMVTADAGGRVQLSVDLRGRTALHLVPAA